MKKGLVIGAVLLILVGLIIAVGNFLSIPGGIDDYVIEDDFSIKDPALIANSDNPQPPCKRELQTITCESDRWKTVLDDPIGEDKSDSTIEEERLKIEAQAKYNTVKPTITFKENLKGKDIRVRLQSNIGGIYPSSDEGFNIYLNEKASFSYSPPSLGSTGRYEAEQSFLFEAIVDFNNPDLYLILVNGQYQKSVLVTETNLNLKFQPFVNPSSGASQGSTLWIDYIQSRPDQNCQIDTDEVVIRERFGPGTFNIDNLQYNPKKFCWSAYPAVRRTLDGKINTDTFGQTYISLRAGESITVNKDEVMEVFPIVDYKQDMGERCDPLIEFYDVASHGCIKFVEDRPDIIQVVYKREFINLGINQIPFQSSLKIGTKEITSSRPSCSNGDEDSAQTTVNYDGNTFIFTVGEEKDLDSFLKLKYIPELTCADNTVKDNYLNNFILTLKNRDFLSIENVGTPLEEYYVFFGKGVNQRFKIVNRYSDFSDSGVIVTKTKLLVGTEQTKETIIIPFKAGEYIYSIDISGKDLGGLVQEVVPYIKIGDEIIVDDEKVIRNYEIVKEVPKDVTLEYSSELKIKKSLWQRVIDFFISLFK